MSIRTIRLDETEEAILGRLRKSTGQSISELLKGGLRALDSLHHSEGTTSAWQVYSQLDLGPGGYASGAADDSRQAAREAILKRSRR